MRLFLIAALISSAHLAAQSSPGGSAIEGHVLSAADGTPLRKASVTLMAQAAPIRLIANTDNAGRFQFSGLPPGTYHLSADRTGFLSRALHRPIQLGSSGAVTDAEIRLQPQGVIAGHVLDEEGEPVEHARVSVFRQSYQNGRRQWRSLDAIAESSDTGEYRIANLSPGRYLLKAYNTRPQTDNQYGSPPKSFYVPVYYPNVVGQEQALPVSVGSGAEASGIDIHLVKIARQPPVRIRGKVTGLQSRSQVPVSVGVFPADGLSGAGNTIATPPEYTFELSAPPGQYTLRANAYSASPDAYGWQPVNVTGDVSNILLTMNAAPEIHGRISLAESGARAKLEGIRVSFTRIDSRLVTELKSDAAGKFTVPKPISPGNYEIVNIGSLPDGCFVREVKLAGKKISWKDFEILTSADLEIILSNTAASVAGAVVDDDGKAIPGASITMIPADDKPRPTKIEADDDGKFQFTGVRPGKYKLFAWEEVDDDLWQDPDFRKSYEGRAAEIAVGPGETQSAQLKVIAADAMK